MKTPDWTYFYYVSYKPNCVYQCLNRILDMVLFDFFLKGSLRKTCDTLEYSGEIRLREEPVEDFKKIRFQYNLDRIMKVQEEYLIYDEVGMIGSVGGTFGMFIGFSFANIVSQILNLIEKFNARSKFQQVLNIYVLCAYIC